MTKTTRKTKSRKSTARKSTRTARKPAPRKLKRTSKVYLDKVVTLM